VEQKVCLPPAKEKKPTAVTSKVSEKKHPKLSTEADSSNDLKKESTHKLQTSKPQSLRPPLQVEEVSNTDTEENEASSSSKKPELSSQPEEKSVATIDATAESVKPSKELSSEEESEDDFDDVELCQSDEVRTNRIFVDIEYDEEAFKANPPEKQQKIDLKTHVFKLFIEDQGVKVNKKTIKSAFLDHIKINET
jgi:hypothetical protein